MRGGVRCNGTDETDRAVPCGRMIGKEEFMAKDNRGDGARVHANLEKINEAIVDASKADGANAVYEAVTGQAATLR